LMKKCVKNNISILFVALLLINSQLINSQVKSDPIKIGVIGLSHSHVHWILSRADMCDIKIVGIVESNKDLAKRYSDIYGYSMDLVFDTMEELAVKTKPQAVTAFGSIYEHLKVVETFAPLGIHIMVEKPLAVSLEHANKMKRLAEKHKIHLFTNYETTWYPTNQKAFDMVQKDSIGELRKVVIHDGHQGPIEIGVNQEFLDWLLDPVKNGGGALMDFGCYGANLVTWLVNGEKPESVIAVTQSIKPDLYQKVEDEATIILQYPKMQAILQASWNWPMSRKDMEIYGKTGYIMSDNRNEFRYRINEKQKEHKEFIEELKTPYNDPFALFSEVIRGNITLPKYDLSSVENNMIVMEILDAAKKSAKSGERVYLKK